MGKDKDKKSKEKISKSMDDKKLKVRSDDSIEGKKNDKKSKKASKNDVTNDDKKSKNASKTDVKNDDKKSKKEEKKSKKEEKKLKKEQAKLEKKSKNQKTEDTKSISNFKPPETYVAPKAEGAYPFLPSRFVMPRGKKGYVYSASPGPARYPVTDVFTPIMKAKKQEDLVKKMITGTSPPAFSLGVKHSDIRCFYNKIE